MEEVSERLREHGLHVELTTAARDWLANIGYDPAFGARPLRRALQKYVESPLSVQLLGGDFKESDTVVVDVDEKDGEEELVFRQSAGVPVTPSCCPSRMSCRTSFLYLAESRQALNAFDSSPSSTAYCLSCSTPSARWFANSLSWYSQNLP